MVILDRVSDTGDITTGGADWRELAFLCADTGAVVAVSYLAGKRPTLTRAVVFLASGDILWIGGPFGGGSPEPLAVRERGTSGQYDLRLSARASLLSGPATLADGEAVAGPRVPVGIELTLEPASRRLALGQGTPAAVAVTLLRGGGSLAAGSVIHRVEGSGWSAAGPDGEPGGLAGSRARAVFQDGSALYVAGGPVVDGTGADGPVLAALVHNTRIRATRVRDFAMRPAGGGRPARTVSWAADGRSPAGASAEIRDLRQRVTVTCPDPAGTGGAAWSLAPFVFVRSGVTGLGLVEQRDRLAAGAAAEELPDPF